MKKPKSLKILFVLALGLLLIGAAAAAIYSVWDGYVFRQVKWGMSLEDVRAREELRGDSELVSDKPRHVQLVYKMNIYDSVAEVTYSFLGEGLSLIRVVVQAPALGAKNFEATKEAFRAAFNAKYGTMDWGQARVLHETWVTSRTCILLTNADKEKTKLEIFYQHPRGCNPKPLIKKEKKIPRRYLKNL